MFLAHFLTAGRMREEVLRLPLQQGTTREPDMERPLFKPVGTPVLRLDTPALVVDVAVLEHNIDTVHAVFRQQPARLRPHVSAHRCPVIAHAQLAAGGTVGGIGVTTLGEAEVFNAHGFRDIDIIGFSQG
jgi:diaminopimelate decarboxylase